MKSLLFHGCYDQSTFQTLNALGVSHFAFDMRARSPNLIPIHQLKTILPLIISEQVTLMFENDLPTTVASVLDILKSQPFKFKLEFRDNMPSSYYRSINHAFYWMFQPDSDWQEILLLPKLEGILLPLKWQEHYHRLGDLWSLIEKRNLKVFLHADNFSEANLLSTHNDVEVSLDLTSEVESGFRQVDQDKLRKIKFWRKLNENSVGQ